MADAISADQLIVLQYRKMSRYNGPLARLLKAVLFFDIPDPWDKEVDEQVRSFDAKELCLECLNPITPFEYLCPNCGWPCGKYVNQMPYLYIFAQGAFFRSGVDGTVRLNKKKILCLAFLATVIYSVFVPIYWFRLYRASKGKFLIEVKAEQGDGSDVNG